MPSHDAHLSKLMIVYLVLSWLIYGLYIMSKIIFNNNANVASLYLNTLTVMS